MKTHVTGHPVLGELRHALAAVFFGNQLFSPEEQLLANPYSHEGEDAQQLARWLRNITAAIAPQHPTGRSFTPSMAGYVV